MKEYNSHFITYELSPGIYTIQDISDAVHTFSGHSNIIEIEYNDISMKTKIILKYKDLRENFGLGTLRFDKKIFFSYFIRSRCILGLQNSRCFY